MISVAYTAIRPLKRGIDARANPTMGLLSYAFQFFENYGNIGNGKKNRAKLKKNQIKSVFNNNNFKSASVLWFSSMYYVIIMWFYFDGKNIKRSFIMLI